MNKNDINRDANLTAEDKEKNENMHDKSDSNNNDEGGVVKEERTDGLQDQTNLLPVKQVIVVFLGISAALFCSLLDQTIVSTALPTISSVFNAGDTSNWVATSYLLTSTAIMPVYSRLSDLIGRKAVLMMCLIIFWLGSLACAVSKTINELIAFRAISGLGGGGILNNSMIIISDVVSLRERGKYQGILGAVVALSNSLGPLLGGVFTDTIGWRWCFYINLPCLGVAIILVQFFLPFKKITGNWREKIVKIDYIGSILVLASTTLILLPLNWGGNKFAWDSAVVIALLIIGILLGVAFVVVENLQKIIPLPILPMYLFKNLSVSASYICTFFSGMIFYGALYYLPQYLQVCAGYSPLKSGVVLLALILTQTIFSFTAGLITSKTGRYRMQIWSGFTVWTVGLGLFITLKPDTPLANFIGYSIIAGVGAGNTFQTTLLSVQAAVARQDMAVATGGRNFIRVLGGTISLALCDAILRNTLIKELNKSGVSENTNIGTILSDPTRIKDLGLSDSVTQEILYDYCIGIRNIFILFTACSGMSFLISLLIRQYSLTRGDEKQLKEEGKQFMQDVKNKKRNKS